MWHELLTRDPAAAQDFYTRAVGWGTTEWEAGEGEKPPYTMWTNGEVPVGGVMELPGEARAEGAPPHWLAYIGTPDVDEAVEEAKRLGASVKAPPTDIPTVGRFAVLADPQGAIFAAFTSESEAPGHDGVPRKGEFSWHELATTDPDAAFDFYGGLFGWEKAEAMDMGEAGIYQMYGRGGPPLGGLFRRSAEMPGPPTWLHYIRVDDVHSAVERVRELGGQVLNGPMEVRGGDYILQALDPQGAAFALHSTGA